MKKFLFKLIRTKLFVLSFFLTCVTASPLSDLQAQSAYAVDAAPQGNFVDVNTAIVRLEAELESIQILLENLNPNTQAFRTLDAKYKFFDNIRLALVNVRTFDSTAVANTIGQISSTLHHDVYGGLSETLREQFKQEVIEVLQQ